jgi:hypothetical protein
MLGNKKTAIVQLPENLDSENNSFIDQLKQLDQTMYDTEKENTADRLAHNSTPDSSLAGTGRKSFSKGMMVVCSGVFLGCVALTGAYLYFAPGDQGGHKFVILHNSTGTQPAADHAQVGLAAATGQAKNLQEQLPAHGIEKTALENQLEVLTSENISFGTRLEKFDQALQKAQEDLDALQQKLVEQQNTTH